MIRVDHAGEHGAARIYEGQLAVLGKRAVGDTIRKMAEQEREHRAAFDRLAGRAPRAADPARPVVGRGRFALGAATALLGERAAMACTVAVEEVIDEHYQQQAAALGEHEPALKATIEEFRADELEHRRHRPPNTVPSRHRPTTVLTAVIKTGSRLAIWLATRL
ncbi:MAG: demethoxyubiquinone hydroxylase family protein [Aliidongia sp.]